VTALDQQIGTGNHPAIWRWQYRTVVANTKHAGRIRRQHSANGGNKAELTEIGDGNDSSWMIHSLLLTARPYGSVTVTTQTVEGDMVQAYILVQTEVGKAAEVALAIGQIPGVTQAEDVTGPYDVIVRAESDNVDDLGRMVVAQIQGVAGITRTLTCPIVHI
jgi:DNA-binding Lrp family transcriptional regulator